MNEIPDSRGEESSGTRICWQCGETFAEELEYCPEDGAQLVELDPTDTKDILVGRVFDYRFRIVGKLGEGGMSRVYAARRLDRDGQVALKILKADFLRDPEVRKRFMYEARVISNLEHPNAVDLFDFGQAPDGSFYMVMELLQGESLADRLDGGALSYREIFSVVPPVCGVLAEAHEQDVIHRDLKPENIFLADMGAEEPVPKLLDFGIAKHLRSRTMTKNDQLWGTPAYMSPEQAAGDPVAGTADIYATGVMIYELVTGVLPFRASTAMGFAVKHMHREASPMRSVPGLEDVPARLDEFVLEMLSKSPEDRPATMSQVARRLREIEEAHLGSSLAETVPAVQTNYSQIESPTDEEISGDDVPPEAARNLTPEAIDAGGKKIHPPEEIGPPEDVSPPEPSSPPRGVEASDVSTNSAASGSYDTPMVGFGGAEEMVPWFRRTPAIVVVAVLATAGVATAYFTWVGGVSIGGSSAVGERPATEGTSAESEAKNRDRGSVTRAAGHAANVTVRARSIAKEIDAASTATAEADDSEGPADPAEAEERDEEQAPEKSEKEGAGEKTAKGEKEEGTFQLVPDSEESSSGATSATGEGEAPGDQSGDEESGIGEENVDEALESTF